MMLIPDSLKQKVDGVKDKARSLFERLRAKFNDEAFMSKVLLGLFAVVLLVVLVTLAAPAKAEPVAVLINAGAGVTITLHNTPCALKDQVSNMPYRATWSQNRKLYEGCFAVYPQAGVVGGFFAEDKSVAVMPMQEFKPLHLP